MVDFAVHVQGGAEEFDVVGVVGYVYLDEDGLRSGFGERFDYGFAGLGVVVSEDDVGAGVGEIGDCCFADAICAA